MKWHVFEIMTRGAYCTTPDTTLEELFKELEAQGLTAAPVLDSERKLTGVVSMRDLALARPDQTVKEVMTSPARVIDQAATIQTVLKAFQKSGVHRLVVTHNDNVLGIVSLVDLLGPLTEAYGYPNFLS